jgi:hypothetical protein
MAFTVTSTVAGTPTGSCCAVPAPAVWPAACATTAALCGEWGASTPKYRWRCVRGGGTKAAMRSISSSGVRDILSTGCSTCRVACHRARCAAWRSCRPTRCPLYAVGVHRVVCAIDCGTVVNPGTVAQQMESSVVYALSAALFGRIEMRERRSATKQLPELPHGQGWRLVFTTPVWQARISLSLAPGALWQAVLHPQTPAGGQGRSPGAPRHTRPGSGRSGGTARACGAPPGRWFA